MLANRQILDLPKTSLETRDILPTYSGIYYVIDEKNVIWYIGKAINIQSRWRGKAHHRFKQLQQQKHKHFYLYYEKVNLTNIDERELQQINRYQPQLNDSPVKSLKTRSTEALLKETIATLSEFSFILGVEPPRKQIAEQIGLDWLKKSKLLNSLVIHVCIDNNKFNSIFQPDSSNEHEGLIKAIFSTRKSYTSKWDCFPPYYSFIYRLGVNGCSVEVNYSSVFIKSKDIDFDSLCVPNNILGQHIKSITPEALSLIKDSSPQRQYNKIQLQRFQPYVDNLIPSLFNEPIDAESAKFKLHILSQQYKSGKRGIGSRSRKITNKLQLAGENRVIGIAKKTAKKPKSSSIIKSKPINCDFITIEELLLSRGIEPNKYDRGNILYMKRYNRERIGLYLECFNTSPQQIYQFQQTVKYQTFLMRKNIYGMKKAQLVRASVEQFKHIYLLAGVDKKAWLLVEEYLQDFAKASTKLDNDESAAEKFYVSPRKFIVPAKVNIKLEKMKYSAWIPFGTNRQYTTFESVRDEIKRRLQLADLPKLKLSFRREHTTK